MNVAGFSYTFGQKVSAPSNRFAHVRADADAQAAGDGLRGRAREGVVAEARRGARADALHRQDGQDALALQDGRHEPLPAHLVRPAHARPAGAARLPQRAPIQGPGMSAKLTDMEY